MRWMAMLALTGCLEGDRSVGWSEAVVTGGPTVVYDTLAKPLPEIPLAAARQGMDEALSLIDALASHPSTARFVAGKLARHFVSDIPAGDVIEFLATRFQQTDGDLAQVSLALLELPQAWDPQNRKFKTPQDFVVSIARALGVTDLSQQGVEALELTGQLPWLAGSPAGYADRAGPWSGADALIKRAEISQEITNQLSAQFLTNVGSPFALAAETLPLSAQSPLGQALSQSQDARTGLALLFASPDFQWR